MGFKVLIPQDVADVGKQYLTDRGYEIKMGNGTTKEVLKEDIKDCDAILLRTVILDAEVLESAKKLKIIAKHGIGIDNVDVKKATELGIYVTNGPLSNSNSVAEHAIGLIIALARNIVYYDKELRAGNFEIRNNYGIDLEGKTLGVIGMGRIGTMVATKASRGLGMKVIGYDPYLSEKDVIPEVQLTREWEYVFKNSDFISLHLPALENTRKIVGIKEFNIMKSTAFIVNASRGEILDELALISALNNKEIAGAALDVFEAEPPQKDNPLFSMNNVIVTPHNAALTKEATARMALHAAIGIDEVLSGKKPGWPCNAPINVRA